MSGGLRLSILAELGLDPEEFGWQDLALCKNYEIKGHREDVFFDKYESDPETARAVDEMCLSCPVMKQCGLAGMDGEQGVYGGIYWNGSGKPDQARNLHKTPEVWERVWERLAE